MNDDFFDGMYSKEQITSHVEDYKKAKQNLILISKTKAYLKANIKCYKIYKLIAFFHFRLHLDNLGFLIRKFKRELEYASSLGNELE